MHCLWSCTYPLPRTASLMVERVDENLVMKLLESVPAENTSVRQLAWKSGIDRKTIRKYIPLIMQVQNAPRLKLETVGMRVLVRKEKPDSEKTCISECPPGQAHVR